MADIALGEEKPKVFSQDEDVNLKVAERKVIKGNEAFNEAFIQDPPQPFSKPMLLVYAASLVGFFCSTMNGYDGSLINNLLINPHFQDTYGVENDGIWAGIVSSMYQIGGVSALPFVGPLCDTWGRRVGMMIGALSVIVGTILQGTASGAGPFMGGRFLLGWGVSIAAAAGPVYVIEINHPAYRGVVGAFYNTLWFSGSILAAGAARGSLEVGEEYSWRLITWLQLAFPSIIVIFSYFLPESPRWLYVNNKVDKAREMLTKYHGRGNPESPWVSLQMHEYQEALNLDGSDKRWWDYRTLFNSRSSRYRVACNVTISAFGQWAGNALVSYFLGSVLDTAGYTHVIEQANITLINSAQQFIFAILGATLVDRVGRRPLFLFSFTGCCIIWLGMTIASSELVKSQTGVDEENKPIFNNPAASKASLALIFIFGAVYSFGITPLQSLYPVEVLSFEMRAKGMALSSLAVNITGLMNQYAWPVSMAKIDWKTYIVFTVWNAVQTGVVYFFIPETKNRTLEELDEIFEAKNPVKFSTAKKTVAVDQSGRIHVEEVEGA